MNLQKVILTKNDCYKSNRTITPVGIVVHSTAANNPWLKRYVQPDNGKIGKNTYGNDWNRSGTGACVNAFIGKLSDGSIATIQTLPWNMRPWGCGKGRKGSYNDTHIQFEICEDGLTDKTYFTKVYNEAVELCAYLCKTYPTIKVENIVCHQEAYQLGYGTNHIDVLHWFPKFGKTMDNFRSDVKSKLNSGYVGEAYVPTKEGFIKDIANAVNKHRLDFGISVASPIIAQACLESNYGKSIKALHHNYFGLKYRKNRVTCNNGTFTDSSREQNSNGSYVNITDKWYNFDTLDKGVLGYFQFINTSTYKNVKGVESPRKYLELLKKDGYATDLKYVNKVMKVINENNLTKYDTKIENGVHILTVPSPTNSYKVKITASVLNVRENPNNSAKVKTTVKKGEIYTIVQEKNGWGKLKSGTGWIYLKYTQKY